MDEHLLRFDKRKTYAFLDFETFNLGLHFLINRPWQCGILKVTGEKIDQAIDILIDWSKEAPHLRIGNEAAILTKYSQERMDREGIQPTEAFNKFWPVLQEVDYIVMHNGLNFDLYLLKAYADELGKDWKFLMPKIIDTKSVAQGIKMQIPFNPKKDNFLEYQYRMANARVKGIKTRLAILGKEYGIDFDENRLHDAIYDLELNKKVWDKMKYQVEI